MADTPSYLFVPGLREHVSEHWQTHLQAQLLAQGHHAHTVPPLTQDKLSRSARVGALDEALAHTDGPVVLIAHSAGVMTVAHWAQALPMNDLRAQHIRGALLATPADVERPLPAGYPSTADLDAGGWLPIPRCRLPFVSLLAASRNDPLAQLARVQGCAQDWGSQLVDIGAVGHLNPTAGFGPWPQAKALLVQLARLNQRAGRA